MFERVSADDLMSLAARRHPLPLQVGSVLIFDARGGLDVGSLRAVLQQRIAAVPRPRQRLQKVPAGLRTAVWVDDPGFNLDDHLTVVEQRSETDDAGLLDLATSLVNQATARSPSPLGCHLCSCPDRRPGSADPRHAPRCGGRIGWIGRPPRAPRRPTPRAATFSTGAPVSRRARTRRLERPNPLTAAAPEGARPALRGVRRTPPVHGSTCPAELAQQADRAAPESPYRRGGGEPKSTKWLIATAQRSMISF